MKQQSPSPPTPPARSLEYVYISASAQMQAGVLKVGETHAQSPEQRVKRSKGVDHHFEWTVLRAISTPNSRATEKMVHRRLKADGRQYVEGSELFNIDLAELVRLVEYYASVTPVPPQRVIARTTDVAVPVERGPWDTVLAMPVWHKDEPRMTLARAMAMVAQGHHALKSRLLNAGIELVYPSARSPDFRVHALPGSSVGSWLATQGLDWAALGIAEGRSRKLRFEVRPGR